MISRRTTLNTFHYECIWMKKSEIFSFVCSQEETDFLVLIWFEATYVLKETNKIKRVKLLFDVESFQFFKKFKIKISLWLFSIFFILNLIYFKWKKEKNFERELWNWKKRIQNCINCDLNRFNYAFFSYFEY